MASERWRLYWGGPSRTFKNPTKKQCTEVAKMYNREAEDGSKAKVVTVTKGGKSAYAVMINTYVRELRRP